MPSASARGSGTAGLPAARETRRRGLMVSEIFADSSGNGLRTVCREVQAWLASCGPSAMLVPVVLFPLTSLDNLEGPAPSKLSSRFTAGRAVTRVPVRHHEQ